MSSELIPRGLEIDRSREQTHQTAVADGAAKVRLSHANGKSWMSQQSVNLATASREDALHVGIDPVQAQNLVKCTTRFATFMCVIIVFVKVGVYLSHPSAIVKTSALDSLGDLVANGITLYTGYRMRMVEPMKFPVGQGKFEPIGVVVFSTLMASAMNVNAINNLEDLMASPEASRRDAVEQFFDTIFAKNEPDPEADRAKKNRELETEPGFLKFQKIVGDGITGHDLPILKKIVKAKTAAEAKEVLEDTIRIVAEEETPEEEYEATWFTVKFLGCCAVYKFWLWLYCIKHAIPKSGSTILVALATDKRNDFMATSFGICCLLIGHYGKEGGHMSEETAEKIDPGASLIYSSWIIYTWVVLIIEQVVTLSQRSVPEIRDPLLEAMPSIVQGSGCEVGALQCYTSSSKHIVEIELLVKDPSAPFSAVNEICSKVRTQVSHMEDIERCIVTVSSS